MDLIFTRCYELTALMLLCCLPDKNSAEINNVLRKPHLTTSSPKMSRNHQYQVIPAAASRDITNSVKESQSPLDDSESQSPLDDSDCCLNGGVCIMNSFCHCKKGFYGRYCQHGQKGINCGKYKHEQMMRSGCDLCQCLYGKIFCLVRTFSGCDHEPAPKEHIVMADPSQPMVSFGEEETDYSYDDYYEEEYTMMSSAEKQSMVFTTFLLITTLRLLFL